MERSFSGAPHATRGARLTLRPKKPLFGLCLMVPGPPPAVHAADRAPTTCSRSAMSVTTSAPSAWASPQPEEGLLQEGDSRRRHCRP